MTSCEDAILYEFKEHSDARGRLVALEGGREIPFDVNRVFYIFDVMDGGIRGKHANKRSDFLLVCVSGHVSVLLRDASGSRIVELESPTKGLFIPHMLWKEMLDFTEDAVLVVFSNRHFDQDEYIDSFEEYLRLCEAC